MELPVTWAKDGDGGLVESVYAKVADDMIDIAIKWGAPLKEYPRQRVFQTKRFGLGLEVTILAKNDPGDQMVAIHSGTDTGGVQEYSATRGQMIRLKARTVVGRTSSGLEYPIAKKEGGIMLGDALSLGDIIAIIGLIDKKAEEKGLLKNGNRIAQPETVYLELQKHNVEKVFAKPDSAILIMPWEDPQDYLKDFDHPDQLVVRNDPWGSEMRSIVAKKNIKYLEQKEQTLNEVLIEKGITYLELVTGLGKDPSVFEPLAGAIGEEVKRRMSKS